jgi:hypothetical protein
MKSQKPLCTARKKSGESCPTPARPGTSFCFSHDPALAQKRKIGSSAGGKRATSRTAVLPPDTPDVCVNTVADVVAMLRDTASRVRRGELDVKIANCLAYIASMILKAIQPDEIDRKIEEFNNEVERLRNYFKNPSAAPCSRFERVGGNGTRDALPAVGHTGS